MLPKTFILLFGVFLAIVATDVSARCHHHHRRVVTYEAVPVVTCGVCSACAMPCMYMQVFEYYSSPRRTSHRSSSQMAEYEWIDP